MAAVQPRLPLRRIVKMRSAWLLGIYHAVSYGSMLSFGNWVPSLLAEVSPGRSATQLAWGGALVMLVSGLGRISGGFIIFRLDPYAVAHGSILALCMLFGYFFCMLESFSSRRMRLELSMSPWPSSIA